ncbi:MAG: hypothetical protein AAGF24_15515 [Cyanobacteria bacterium P01_H01_bin.121]
MTDRSKLIKAIRKLDPRFTVGDAATKAGLDLQTTEQGLLALASEVGGTLQVADTGEIVYQFPNDPEGVLRSKYFKLRLQAVARKLWQGIFYVIRISFGLLLMLSIALLAIAIVLVIIGITASQKGGQSDDRSSNRSSNTGLNLYFLTRILSSTDWYWFFYMGGGRPRYRQGRSYKTYDNYSYKQRRSASTSSDSSLNFLEAVFSYLFGDGDPNDELDERRWQEVATVIRNNKGSVVAEQLAPYLDQPERGFDEDYEDYMLPVLTRFNGRPQVSPSGQLIYAFPELQTTTSEWRSRAVEPYLQEEEWEFSQASSGQITGAVTLGAVNLALAVVFGLLIWDPSVLGSGDAVSVAAEFVGFVAALFPVLLAYALGFFAIPGIRYFSLQGRNRKIRDRNTQRRQRAQLVDDRSPELVQKLDYAQKFATEMVINPEAIAYSTDQDLIEQEVEQKDKLDQEWQQRLEAEQS